MKFAQRPKKLLSPRRWLTVCLVSFAGAVLLCWSVWVVTAANRTWTGGTPGDPSCPVSNPLWTNQCNWTGKVLPVAGDDLTFGGSLQGSSTNNFANGTTFNSLSVSGSHQMSGNSVSLNAGITSANALIALSSLKLNNNQTFVAPTAGTGGVIQSVIDTNGKTLTLDGPGVFQVVGLIGGSGGLIKTGSGVTVLAGNNTYTGVTEVNVGTLLVFGSQPASSVLVRNGSLGGTGTVGSVQVAAAIAGGSLSPGNANHGTGVLTINGNLNVLTPASFDVDLNVADREYDQLTVNGTVNLGPPLSPLSSLNVTLTSIPSPGSKFLIVKNDGAGSVVGAFSGKPEGSSFTINGTTFFITYRGGDGNDVVLHVPRIWDGGGADSNWMTAANWVGDVAPLAGDYLIFPQGAARKGNINNFPADTNFGSITFNGDGYLINGNPITLSNGVIANAPAGSVSTFIPGIKLTQAQTFLSNSPCDLVGQLNLNSFQLTFDGSSNHVVRGNIVGSGGIVKNGSSTSVLFLGGASNTYTGVTEINAGLLILPTRNGLGASGPGNHTIVATGATLELNNDVKDIPESLFLNGIGQNLMGALATNQCNLGCSISGSINLGSDVDTGIRVASSSDRLTLDGVITGAPDQSLGKLGTGTLILNGTYAGPTDVSSGTLLVNGTVGNVRLVVATLGGTGTVGALTGSGWVAPGASPGILNANGNASFGSHGTVTVELGGTTVGTQYDRLNVNGTVSLNGTTLDGQLINGFTPAAGNQFTIIQSTGTISGQFAQGNSINIGGMGFSITYNTNSVVLTATGVPPPTIFVVSNNPSEAVALDSVTFARGPFRTRSDNNFSADHQTRVILFTTNLGLSQADLSKVTVSVAGSLLPVETVGTVTGVPGLDASYIVVRLLDGLPPGNHPLIVIANGVQSTNSPTFGIAP